MFIFCEIMDKGTAQRRLEVTRRQVSRFENLIADAPRQRSGMDERVYKAMVAGYESQLAELRVEEKSYQEALA